MKRKIIRLAVVTCLFIAQTILCIVFFLIKGNLDFLLFAFLSMLLLVILFLPMLIKNTALDARAKIVWLLSFVFLTLFAIPYYLYRYRGQIEEFKFLH